MLTVEGHKLFSVKLLHVTLFKGATSRFVHLEKFSLNFSSCSFSLQSVLIFSILNHLCSFFVYYYFFGVFLSYQANVLWFPSCSESYFARRILHSKYRDVAPLNKVDLFILLSV